MKKSIIFAILLILSACAYEESIYIPPLNRPVSAINDTFIVEYGRIIEVLQYRAIVRSGSEGVFFSYAPLSFWSYEVLVGQEVRAGDVLARLDTRSTNEQIMLRRERISDMQEDFLYRQGQTERQINISNLEHLAILTRIADYPAYQLLEDAEQLRITINRLELELQQAQEWHEFHISHERAELELLENRLAASVLTAPVDGVITYIEQIPRGGYVESFRPIIYINSGENLFLEYAAVYVIPVPLTATLMARIEDRVYELERITYTEEEARFFTREGNTLPVRFNFINPDEYLQPGQFAALRIYTDIADNVLRIPISAAFRNPDGDLYVNALENGQRVIRVIETGLSTEAWIEVISGLVEGDEIFV